MRQIRSKLPLLHSCPGGVRKSALRKTLANPQEGLKHKHPLTYKYLLSQSARKTSLRFVLLCCPTGRRTCGRTMGRDRTGHFPILGRNRVSAAFRTSGLRLKIPGRNKNAQVCRSCSLLQLVLFDDTLNILYVRHTGVSTSRFTGFCDIWHCNRHEHSDNSDHNHDFNEGETTSRTLCSYSHNPFALLFHFNTKTRTTITNKNRKNAHHPRAFSSSNSIMQPSINPRQALVKTLPDSTPSNKNCFCLYSETYLLVLSNSHGKEGIIYVFRASSSTTAREIRWLPC